MDEGRVVVVGLNRPHARNAVDRPTAEALTRALREELEADPRAKVGVLHGIGGTFCAGADLKAISPGESEEEAGGGDQREGSSRRNRLLPHGDGPMGPTRLLLSKPVIAAISGYAVAGGLELACWCDLRVVEEDATFGVFCRRWGVPLIDGGTVRLPRLIGMSRALDMILTGRPVSAAEALQAGLANRVVPSGQAKQAAIELARSLAAFPELCLRCDRMSAYEQWDLSLEEALRNEFRKSLPALEREMRAGAARFAAGVGRHGSFDASPAQHHQQPAHQEDRLTARL